MKNKRYFPMFIDLSDKKVVVVGGGKTARSRVGHLLSFTRNVTVVDPHMNSELLEMGKAGRIRIQLRSVKRADLEEAYMVVAASEDWRINYEVYKVCKEEGIYVNVADDPEESDFFFPELCITKDVVAGLSSQTLTPGQMKKIQREIVKILENPEEE